MSFLHRLVFISVVPLVCSVGVLGPLNASTIAFTYTTPPGGVEYITYIDNPATTNPARDSFFANIVSPQFGNGTVSVPDDYTDYVKAIGYADVATFTFASGTFSGSEYTVLNLSTGSSVITYTITSGTSAFSGAMGTITVNARLLSFGSFSPNVPATAEVVSAGGPLTLVPEPGTSGIMILGLALLWGLGTAQNRATRNFRCAEPVQTG